jgi:hypothetical protein
VQVLRIKAPVPEQKVQGQRSQSHGLRFVVSGLDLVVPRQGLRVPRLRLVVMGIELLVRDFGRIVPRLDLLVPRTAPDSSRFAQGTREESCRSSLHVGQVRRNEGGIHGSTLDGKLWAFGERELDLPLAVLSDDLAQHLQGGLEIHLLLRVRQVGCRVRGELEEVILDELQLRRELLDRGEALHDLPSGVEGVQGSDEGREPDGEQLHCGGPVRTEDQVGIARENRDHRDGGAGLGKLLNPLVMLDVLPDRRQGRCHGALHFLHQGPQVSRDRRRWRDLCCAPQRHMFGKVSEEPR